MIAITQLGLQEEIKQVAMSHTQCNAPSVAIEYGTGKANLVEQTSNKRPGTHSNTLTNNKPARKGGAPTNADEPHIGTIPFVVHGESKRKSAGDSAKEDKIEPVCMISEAVEDVA